MARAIKNVEEIVIREDTQVIVKEQKKSKKKRKKNEFGSIDYLGKSLRDVKKGEILHSEKPNVIAVHEKKVNCICAQCFQIKMTLSSLMMNNLNNLCPKCLKISYCSEQCKALDADIHEIECNWLKNCKTMPDAYSRAINDIKRGAILYSEKPNAIVVHEDKIKSICAQCFQIEISLSHFMKESTKNIMILNRLGR
ncbi:hypothetical protein MXB_161 [Myxobolus squamalis]|nr:hypothetical protein MXB_161 [Myxobolus squamalis]